MYFFKEKKSWKHVSSTHEPHWSILTAFIWAEKTENKSQCKLKVNTTCISISNAVSSPKSRGRMNWLKVKCEYTHFWQRIQAWWVVWQCFRALCIGEIYTRLGREELEQHPGIGNKDDIPTTLLCFPSHLQGWNIVGSSQNTLKLDELLLWDSGSCLKC